MFTFCPLEDEMYKQKFFYDMQYIDIHFNIYQVFNKHVPRCQVFFQYNFPLLLLILQLALCHEGQHGRLDCDQEAQGGGASLPFLLLICFCEIDMSICSV